MSFNQTQLKNSKTCLTNCITKTVNVISEEISKVANVILEPLNESGFAI